MSIQPLILHLLMNAPASRYELRRRLSPFRALEVVGDVDLDAELEDLEKRGCLCSHTDPSDSRSVRRFGITEAGSDELAEWLETSLELAPSHAGATSPLTLKHLLGSEENADGHEWLRRELSDLEEEISGWRASVVHRQRHSRLALLADEYRLRSLESRQAYLRDALDLTVAAPVPRALVAVASVAWRAQSRNRLASAGYEVRLAESRDQAWDLLQSAYYDVLILDPGMENQDGFELLSRVRTSTWLSDLPVIWSGISQDPEERDAALAAGASAYLWMCDREAGRQLLDRVEREVLGRSFQGSEMGSRHAESVEAEQDAAWTMHTRDLWMNVRALSGEKEEVDS